MEEKIKQLVCMGFSEHACRAVMQKNPALDMEAAIALIVEEPVEVAGPIGPAPKPSAAGAVTVAADDEMERAIQMSLKEKEERDTFQEEIKGGKGYKDPESPFDRKRDSLEIPAGIKNVGNTCYINSLLQAMFLVPQFRVQLLEIALAKQESPGERLIHELQLLFSRMLLTERRYVDPSPLLEFTSHHGAQEDPTELFLDLLDKIRDGINKLVSPKPEDELAPQPMDLSEEGSVDLVTRFFEGSTVQAIHALENNGTEIERTTAEKFMQIICSVPQLNETHLHDLLEQFTTECFIDGYQTPLGHVTQAKKSVLFDDLPPILTLQLQRVSWINNALQKNNSKVVFDDVMYMDRYLHSNEKATFDQRKRVNSLREELAALKGQMAAISNYKGTTVSVTELLGHASSYLQDRHAVEARGIIESLARFSELAKKNSNELKERIEQIQYQISVAYDGFPREFEYRLHAILVHSGSPDLGGHYWAYIRDHKSGTWFKFNDVAVHRVDKVEDMTKESFGEVGGMTSAYALVYLRHLGEAQAWNTCQGVPLWARKLVEQDNEAFEAECRAWRVAHPQELTVKEKEAKFEATMADLKVPADHACLKASQYAARREQPQRVVELVAYDEVGLQPRESASDPERSVVTALKKDFVDYARVIRSMVHAMRKYSQGDMCSAAGYLAFAAKEAQAQTMGPALYLALHKALRTIGSKALFSAMLRANASSVNLCEAWAATYYQPPDAGRREAVAAWKVSLQAKGKDADVVRQLVNNDKAPVLDHLPMMPEESYFAVCQDFDFLWPKFSEQFCK